MALIYLGYRALKKKTGEGGEDPELSNEEKIEKLEAPVKDNSKAASKLYYSQQSPFYFL